MNDTCLTCNNSGIVIEHCGAEFCGGCDNPDCIQLDEHPCPDCDWFWRTDPEAG